MIIAMFVTYVGGRGSAKVLRSASKNVPFLFFFSQGETNWWWLGSLMFCWICASGQCAGGRRAWIECLERRKGTRIETQIPRESSISLTISVLFECLSTAVDILATNFYFCFSCLWFRFLFLEFVLHTLSFIFLYLILSSFPLLQGEFDSVSSLLITSYDHAKLPIFCLCLNIEIVDNVFFVLAKISLNTISIPVIGITLLFSGYGRAFSLFVICHGP